jgi:hypothetical protein
MKEVFVRFHDLPKHGIPPYHRIHIGRLMRRGQFPAAVQLSQNRIAWRVSDLEDWIASRPIAASCLRKDTASAPAPNHRRPRVRLYDE